MPENLSQYNDYGYEYQGFGSVTNYVDRLRTTTSDQSRIIT